jgi:hypothetical protein
MSPQQTATGKPRATVLGYLLGVILIIGGIAWGGVLAAQAVVGMAEGFAKGEEFVQKAGVSVPTENETVTLPEPGEYTVWVYFEGKQKLSTDDPALKKLAKTVYVAAKPMDASKSVSMSAVSGDMTFSSGRNVAFGVFSLDSGDANQVRMTTNLDTDELSGELATAMDDVENIQVVVQRFNTGGAGGKLQTAGMVAGGGIVLGIVVIVITAVRRSKPAPQPVANPYQDQPSEPPVSGRSPSADTPGQGDQQAPPQQQ